MKLCNKCLIEKEIVDFPKHRNMCKECLSVEYKKYYKDRYEKNKDKIIEKSKEYYINNKDKVKEYKKEYQQKNKEKLNLISKKYREENKDTVSDAKKEWYQENKDKVKKYQKDNKDHLTSKKREHYHKNKDRYNELNRIYIRNKKANNPLYKLSCSIRTLITQSFKLKYTKKAKRTTEILGCSFDEFKIHIESKFTKEMNWDNYAKYWQLDHIIPISWAKTEEEIYKLNHYTNFQPLEWRENISKGNRYSH